MSAVGIRTPDLQWPDVRAGTARACGRCARAAEGGRRGSASAAGIAMARSSWRGATKRLRWSPTERRAQRRRASGGDFHHGTDSVLHNSLLLLTDDDRRRTRACWCRLPTAATFTPAARSRRTCSSARSRVPGLGPSLSCSWRPSATSLPPTLPPPRPPPPRWSLPPPPTTSHQICGAAS